VNSCLEFQLMGDDHWSGASAPRGRARESPREPRFLFSILFFVSFSCLPRTAICAACCPLGVHSDRIQTETGCAFLLPSVRDSFMVHADRRREDAQSEDLQHFPRSDIWSESERNMCGRKRSTCDMHFQTSVGALFGASSRITPTDSTARQLVIVM